MQSLPILIITEQPLEQEKRTPKTFVEIPRRWSDSGSRRTRSGHPGSWSKRLRRGKPSLARSSERYQRCSDHIFRGPKGLRHQARSYFFRLSPALFRSATKSFLLVARL